MKTEFIKICIRLSEPKYTLTLVSLEEYVKGNSKSISCKSAKDFVLQNLNKESRTCWNEIVHSLKAYPKVMEIKAKIILYPNQDGHVELKFRLASKLGA